LHILSVFCVLCLLYENQHNQYLRLAVESGDSSYFFKTQTWTRTTQSRTWTKKTRWYHCIRWKIVGWMVQVKVPSSPNPRLPYIRC